MSTFDLSPEDLKYIGNDCLTISTYCNDASKDPDLQHLISAFGELGRQLHSLADKLETSGLEDTSYHDMELQDRVHDAGDKLQQHFAITETSRRAQSERKKILGPKNIPEFQQHVDSHMSKAKNRETNILL